jgi:hypothetical protein
MLLDSRSPHVVDIQILDRALQRHVHGYLLGFTTINAIIACLNAMKTRAKVLRPMVTISGSPN